MATTHLGLLGSWAAYLGFSAKSGTQTIIEAEVASLGVGLALGVGASSLVGFGLNITWSDRTIQVTWED